MAIAKALEFAMSIPEGHESQAAAELVAHSPAETRAILRAFAASLVSALEAQGDRRVVVLDLPAAVAERVVRDLGH
jgi:hypothetical protein